MEKIKISFVKNGRVIRASDVQESMELKAMESVKEEISNSLRPLHEKIRLENGKILLVEDKGEIRIALNGFSEELEQEIQKMLAKF